MLHETSDPTFEQIECAKCGTVVRRPYPKITFVPAPGNVLLCNFAPGFQPPEMVKLRPVIVVSPSSYNRDTVTIVPLSTQPPTRPNDTRVVSIDAAKYGFLTQSGYAKGNMVTTVSNGRLYRLIDPATGKQIDGRTTRLNAEDLAAVREAIKAAIGTAAPLSVQT